MNGEAILYYIGHSIGVEFIRQSLPASGLRRAIAIGDKKGRDSGCKLIGSASGDVANKIGTYSLSILAKEHNIPFYVVAPSSTFDLNTKNGKDIPIEERPTHEVTTLGGVKTAPADIKVYNPAFDVTDAENITAIITEKGVIEKPDAKKIAAHMHG